MNIVLLINEKVTIRFLFRKKIISFHFRNIAQNKIISYLIELKKKHTNMT